jgi:nucleoid DNA-binding protein
MRSEFIDTLQGRLEKTEVKLNKTEVEVIYREFIDTILSLLSEKKEVTFSGLGKFSVKTKKVGIPDGHPFLAGKPTHKPVTEINGIKFKPYPSAENKIN